MPTWTSAKWTTRIGSATVGFNPPANGGAPAGGSSRPIDLRPLQAQQAQAQEQLTAVVDDLLENVPQDPPQFGSPVPRNLHDPVEVIDRQGRQIGNGGFVRPFQLVSQGGDRRTVRIAFLRPGRQVAADHVLDPAVLEVDEGAEDPAPPPP